ncbi:rab-GTPase-TBC domain-containing protein [Choanephora cucurbitarum]|nr:rab-GTPase-TBC domain-containing protein [Choanephora cucurbitarum]
MSLFDLYYTNNEADQIRLAEQQKSIQDAFEGLLLASAKQQQDYYQYSYRADYQSDNNQPFSVYHDLRDDNSSVHSASYSSGFSSKHRASSIASSITTLDHKETSETSERDRYGFKQSTDWVDSEKLYQFEKRYEAIQRKQLKRWRKLFDSNNTKQWPELCPDLMNYARSGIPHEYRAKAWMHYSGAEVKMNSNSGVYQSLLAQIQESPELIEDAVDSIRKDLYRTFPNNSNFAQDDSYRITMLDHVLSAFSLYLPEIGYCQSLNFLAGFLLLFYDTEEEAFWMLVTIVQDYFPKGMFDATMKGTQIEQTVLMNLIYEHMPATWSKISEQRCFWECEQKEQDNFSAITLITTHWFLTMYINIMPVETVLRIWDCFFIGDGFKVIYQVALTILKLNEERILKAEDSIGAFQVLQNMPRRMIDCDKFIKVRFEGKAEST